MKTKLAISLIFLSATLALAMPIKLTVQPKGANQIQLTFGPVTAQDWYQVWVRTNGPDGHWMLLSSFSTGSNTALSVTTALGGIPGLTTETLTNWTFVAGKWDDSEGDELPMIYKELALRTDPYAPADPYGDPMGDGWNNVEKMKNNMAPYKWCTPRPPQLSLKFFGRVSNSLKEQAILTWQIWNSAPDYFVIERAHQQSRQPFSQNSDRSVTGPFAVIAQIPSQPGAHDYQYTDTNADISSVYQIQSHYPISHHAHLDQVNADSIRKTILTVTARQTTNGYTLIAMNPIPDAWYLLLVRDKNDPQWRASGYFTSGTNRAPVYLHVDKKGMMSDGQSPISMPNVHFLPDVVEPEFTAGWGEDSDGDGLPDIYEVLVTHTDPDNADTGNAGILDGYKEMTDDGWNNLEKFRRRIDPLRPAKPSATMELKQPTGIEIIDAITPKTDLSCELEIAIRTNGATDFQPIEQVPSMLSKITNFRQPKDRRNFDLRISWRFTKPGLNQYGENLFDRDSPFQAIESLLEKTRIELAEQFKAKLAAGPALSPSDLSNNIAGLFHDYRQDGMDKGVAMVEMMALRDNQSQDYYGQVVDQYGQPVVDADVTAHINLTMGEGETFRTRTDANGSFQFTGIRGKSLSITPSKTGFQIDNAHLGLKGLNGPETNPNKREIYTMWKLKGAEPLISYRIDSKIPHDGMSVTFDIASQKIDPNGDFIVSLTRSPLMVRRSGENFDWNLKIEMLQGGIKTENDTYPYWAPDGGYASTFTIDMNSNNIPWFSRFAQSFYVKNKSGQYGLMNANVYTALTPVRVQFDFTFNPSGSQNLEPAR